MPSSPLSTIGIPYTNNANCLAIAIGSVLAQYDSNWQLLLIGDEPNKECENLVNALADARIQRIRSNPRRQGLAYCLNRIADHADGEILFRMDADDVMTPDRVSEQKAFLLDSPSVDVVGSHAYAIDERNKLIGMYRTPAIPDRGNLVLSRTFFTHPTVAGRREWFRRNRYDESFARAQDRELWLRTFPTSKFALLQKPLLFYRLHSADLHSKRMISSRYDRLAVARHGPSLVGRAGTAKYIATAIAKDALYKALLSLGREKILGRRRTEAIGEQDLDSAHQLLKESLGVDSK